MKKLLSSLFLLLVVLSADAQISSRLLNSQAKPYRKLHADNFLYVDTLPGGEYRIWAVTVDSLLVKPHNVKWLKDSIVMIGNQRYVQLAGAYSNPSWVNSLSAGKVFGLSSVATTGDYNDLTNKPNLSLYYLNSNPNGYINGITSSLVTGALGYTPVSSSRTLTINGVTYDLSANRSWTVGAPTESVYNPTRSLNSNFTISSTKQARVAYTVSLVATNPLLVGSSVATVYLEYSTNGGTNWILVGQVANSSSIGLAVTIAITNSQTSVVSGSIPANALVRLRSVTSGTATATLLASQETY